MYDQGGSATLNVSMYDQEGSATLNSMYDQG